MVLVNNGYWIGDNTQSESEQEASLIAQILEAVKGWFREMTEWVVGILTADELIADELEAGSLILKDRITGEPHCVQIKEGEWLILDESCQPALEVLPETPESSTEFEPVPEQNPEVAETTEPAPENTPEPAPEQPIEPEESSSENIDVL